MSATVAVAGAVLGAIVLIGSAVKAWPWVWKLLCLPARLDEMFRKLDSIDAMREDSVQALEEWKGASQAVRGLAENHDRRIASLEAWRKRVERRDSKEPT